MAADNISVDQCKRKFIDFLVDERLDGKYSHRIEQCIREKKRFILNINDVRADENDWASRLIRRPREHMIALQEAVIETGKNLNRMNIQQLRPARLRRWKPSVTLKV